MPPVTLPLGAEATSACRLDRRPAPALLLPHELPLIAPWPSVQRMVAHRDDVPDGAGLDLRVDLPQAPGRWAAPGAPGTRAGLRISRDGHALRAWLLGRCGQPAIELPVFTSPRGDVVVWMARGA